MINSPCVCFQVQGMYIDTQSQPESDRYVFAYIITLRNLSRHLVQLIGCY